MEGNDETGQATAEWVGLVLAVGLALGALAGGVRGATGGDDERASRALGEAVAERITCAARDLCGAERGAERHAGGGEGAALGDPPGADGALGGPPGADGALGGPPSSLRAAPGRPPSVPVERRSRRPSRRAGSEALRKLRGLGRAAEGAWLACLGYRALEYDLEHPRTPREMRPLDETLEIVNDCVNPWEFLFGG